MDNIEIKTVPRCIRMQNRIWNMGVKKSTEHGMKMPAYISQLIVKDNNGG